MDIDCFWLFVVYVQINLVFVYFDICVSIVQFCQYCVQSVWLCVMVEDFVVRDCCCYQESFCFDMIWQYMINVVVQMFYVFDCNMIGVLFGDFCFQCNQEVSGVDNFWFVCGVFNDGCFFCQCSGVYNGDGCVDVDFIYYDMCFFKMFFYGGFYVVFFQFDGCIQLFQIGNMQINWMCVDSIVFWQRDLFLIKMGNQWFQCLY